MSTFSGLNTATTALWAQQRGLDVTGQNVSNANTDGYSRQRVNLQSVGGNTVPAIYSVSNQIGGGVNSDSVIRIRDAFLEGRAQTEHANSAQLTVNDSALTQIQQAFREPGTTGIQSQLADMWSAWQDVASHPGDAPTGQALLATTQTLVDGLHSTRASLDTQWTQTRSDLQTLVTDVNSTAGSIADLNQAIQRATQSGGAANELSDQRDALVLHLAEQIGATSQPGDGGAINVVIGGVSLVSGSSSTALAVAGPLGPDGLVPSTDPTFSTTDHPRIVTATGAVPIGAGGTAGGGLNTLNNLVPTYRIALDQTAVTLAGQLNAQQAKGFDGSGASGTAMFGSSMSGPSSDPITAKNIALLISQPSQIAASSVPPVTTTTPGVGGASPVTTVTAAVNGGNADAMSQLSKGGSSPDTGYRQMITGLGVQAATASRTLDIQTTVTSQLDSDRESVSGVNLDEEMTNMLAYQHAYSAAGRLITAIDQMLDTLINHTGVVGMA